MDELMSPQLERRYSKLPKNETREKFKYRTRFYQGLK